MVYLIMNESSDPTGHLNLLIAIAEKLKQHGHVETGDALRHIQAVITKNIAHVCSSCCGFYLVLILNYFFTQSQENLLLA